MLFIIVLIICMCNDSTIMTLNKFPGHKHSILGHAHFLVKSLNHENYVASINVLIKDLVFFKNLKHPKIFFEEGISNRLDRVFLVQSLSEQNIVCTVQEGSLESFPNRFWRSITEQSVIVIGNNTFTVDTLNLLLQAKVLNRRGTIVFICQNCDQDSLSAANGKDSLGDIWLGIPYKGTLSTCAKFYDITFSYRNLKFNSQEMGLWNVTNGFHKHLNRSKHKFDFENATLTVLATNTVPYTVPYTDLTGISPPKGFIGKIISLLKDVLNFTFVVNATKYDYYGELQNNGSFSGGLGEFLREKFDIAAGIYSFTPSRRKVFSFTSPIARGDMIFAAHLPRTSSDQSWTVALRSFSFQLWVAFFVVLVIACVTLIFGYHWDFPGNWKCDDYLHVLMAIYLMQGGDIKARSLSTKILVFSTCLFCWMLLCIYNAVLFSKLTMSQEDLVTTLEELSNSDYTVAATTGSSSFEIVKTSKSKILIDLRKRMITFNTTFAGIDAMCLTENLALITGMALLFNYLRTKDSCSYYAVHEVVFTDDFHFITQPNGVLHKRISKAITILAEKGFLLRFVTRYNLRTTQKAYPEVRDVKETVDLDQMLGPFIVHSIGILMSLVALVFELLFDRLHRWRKRIKISANLNKIGQEDLKSKDRSQFYFKAFHHSASTVMAPSINID